MKEKIFDSSYEDYLNNIQNINEEIIPVTISGYDEIEAFANQYGDDIAEFFKDGAYSHSEQGKLQALKDYQRRKNIMIRLDNSNDWSDIINNIDWLDTSDVEQMIDRIEDLMDSMNGFIEEYRDNDSYFPDPKKVLRNWINELEELYDEILQNDMD